MKPELCARCGGPNVNGQGEPTGEHRDVDECLREMNARVRAVEKLATDERVQRIVVAFERDLRGRNGFDTGCLPEDVQQEMRDAWTKIVRDALA